VVHMTEPKWVLDVDVYDEYGDGHWAQARYLVHGYDDVCWTNDPAVACRFLLDQLRELAEREVDLDVGRGVGIK